MSLWVERRPAMDGDNMKHLLVANFRIQLFSTLVSTKIHRPEIL